MAILVKSVDHALEILFAIAATHGEKVTLTSLAERVDLPLANVLRFLRTLEKHGLVVRNEKREIMLGFGVVELSAAFQSGAALGPVSVPYLRELRDLTGETTALQIALGTHRACIQQVVSEADVKWAVDLGRRFPLVTGAAGRVLMAFMSPDECRSVLKKASSQADGTRIDLRAFERELAAVRRDGFALSIDGTLVGASAVAAPVRDHSGVVAAAMTIAGPTDRMPKKRLLELAKQVVASASDLSAELGNPGGTSRATAQPTPSKAKVGRSTRAVASR